ncbi:NlpC/P60 family protein [Clostridium sp. SHJSY1]|uniref:NlpC/P60 family protein n=1 Tax=Clostridium sp. SHJSY1 TaxID=2942483 RepID=UPI002875BC7C|nr:NlpC/P60 family protein [Clostridium sp. SHJSY1]MDS0525544.1 NlpC/P60 family protein [Clostridium sp. SHJSY1]
MKFKNIILTVVLGIFQMLLFNVNTKAATNNEMIWEIHTATALESTSSNWQFRIGDYNNDGVEDLYSIKKDGGAHTNLHILSGESTYQKFLLQTALPIEATGDTWTFELGDYNGDGIQDLYCIRKDSGAHTNLHILDGSTNFQTFLNHIILPIENTDNNWEFKTGDYDGDGISDLYCIKKNAGNHTNLHVLSGKENYENFLCQVQLPIENTGINWEFGVNDFNQDKISDLYCIKKDGGTSTNIHILNGSNRYQTFLLQTTTIERPTNESTQFIVGKGNLNIYCIDKYGTNSQKTELHKFGWQDLEPEKSKVDKVIDEAMKHLGKQYVYGAEGPNVFDCSGYTSYVYRQALNIEIGRTTYDQINSGREISQSELKPGDLVFPHSGHVGIYVGNGQMVHAPQTGDVVKVSSVYNFWRARRIIE